MRLSRLPLLLALTLGALGLAHAASAQACTDLDITSPDALVACLTDSDPTGRYTGAIQLHESCRTNGAYLMRGAYDADRSLSQDTLPACDVVADAIELIRNARPYWSGCLGYDPAGDPRAQTEACLNGHVAGRNANGDLARVPQFLARMPCNRMQSTYLSAMEDAYPRRELPDGRIVNLPEGFTDPGCPVYDAIREDAAAVVQAEADAARAEQERLRQEQLAEQRRKQEEARQRQAAQRAEQERLAKARAEQQEKARAAQQAQQQTTEAEKSPEQLAAEAEHERQMQTNPSYRAAFEKLNESAGKLAESMKKAAEARATFETTLDELQALKDRDLWPEADDVQVGMIRTIRRAYARADCTFGFRSNLKIDPAIEVCVNYVQFSADCHYAAPGAYMCNVGFGITVTSPTHPQLNNQLAQSTQQVQQDGMVFVKYEDDWHWAARNETIHAFVPTEFRGRDPFGN